MNGAAENRTRVRKNIITTSTIMSSNFRIKASYLLWLLENYHIIVLLTSMRE